MKFWEWFLSFFNAYQEVARSVVKQEPQTGKPIDNSGIGEPATPGGVVGAILPGVTERVAFGAPWVIANHDMIGREESDPVLNARYVPEWKLEGLDYKTLAGNDHAWCSLAANADLRKVGIKGTDSAGASSWSKWGTISPYYFGAILPIEHQSGGRHVCKFLYWIDDHSFLCATLDGNKNNRYAVNVTDLSKHGDKVVPAPRWPLNWPAGMFVSKEEVLKKYPFLKFNGSAGGSTT